jgi:hypothetical protein
MGSRVAGHVPGNRISRSRLRRPVRYTRSIRSFRLKPYSSFRDNGLRSEPDDSFDDVCLSEAEAEAIFDDLDVLKAKMSLIEEIERAVSTIEARVDHLDGKLVDICDSDAEQGVLIRELLAERERQEDERHARAARRKMAAGDGSGNDGSRATNDDSLVNVERRPGGSENAGGFHFDTEILGHPFHQKRNAATELPMADRDVEMFPGNAENRGVQSHHKGLNISEVDRETDRKRIKTEKAWDMYRGSFTVILTKGYLQAVENLRVRMLIQEWEQNLQNLARMNGIARFEAFCAISQPESITFAVIEQLYDTHGKDLTCIEDEFLRMRCHSLIKQEEAKMKKECYDRCTEEARRLANVFSKTDFLSKVLPDPIEHGLVSSVETLMAMFKASKM